MREELVKITALGWAARAREGLIRSGASNPLSRTAEGTVPPVAVLWTDQEGAWRPVVSRLRTELPHLFTLGDYNAEARTGPTIWLKCIVDRTLAGAPPLNVAPILYLPGVSRQELRAGGDCRPAYQPLVELLFRGRAWHQENGKDWSVEAFLLAADGLGFDVARDTLTRDAIAKALPVLAATSLDGLCGRRLANTSASLLRTIARPDSRSDQCGSAPSK